MNMIEEHDCIVLTEDLPDYHQKYGEALMLQGRHAEARRHLEKALAEGEPSDELLMVMGNCLLSDSKPAEAAEYFRTTTLGYSVGSAMSVIYHSLFKRPKS